MGKTMGLQLTGTFKFCKACALGKDKMAGVSKMAVPCSMVKGKWLFIDISSPSTASLGGKKHWLLAVGHKTGYVLSYYLK